MCVGWSDILNLCFIPCILLFDHPHGWKQSWVFFFVFFPESRVMHVFCGWLAAYLSKVRKFSVCALVCMSVCMHACGGCCHSIYPAGSGLQWKWRQNVFKHFKVSSFHTAELRGVCLCECVLSTKNPTVLFACKYKDVNVGMHLYSHLRLLSCI